MLIAVQINFRSSNLLNQRYFHRKITGILTPLEYFSDIVAGSDRPRRVVQPVPAPGMLAPGDQAVLQRPDHAPGDIVDPQPYVCPSQLS